MRGEREREREGGVGKRGREEGKGRKPQKKKFPTGRKSVRKAKEATHHATVEKQRAARKRIVFVSSARSAI